MKSSGWILPVILCVLGLLCDDANLPPQQWPSCTPLDTEGRLLSRGVPARLRPVPVPRRTLVASRVSLFLHVPVSVDRSHYFILSRPFTPLLRLTPRQAPPAPPARGSCPGFAPSYSLPGFHRPDTSSLTNGVICAPRFPITALRLQTHCGLTLFHEYRGFRLPVTCTGSLHDSRSVKHVFTAGPKYRLALILHAYPCMPCESGSLALRLGLPYGFLQPATVAWPVTPLAIQHCLPSSVTPPSLQVDGF